MNAALLCILAALIALVLYGVLGGADFGGGVWDLFARGSRKEAQRKAIAQAMGPVWETNHVWLIFAMVALFTCFPPVFARLSVALYFPLTSALIGIILRGAAFAFRGPAREHPAFHAWTYAFGAASLVAPFFFGTCAAAVMTGSLQWESPFAFAVGLFAVTLCAQVAAVFLCVETRGTVQDDFRIKALWATLAVALCGLLCIGAASLSDESIIPRLMHGWIAVGGAMLLGVAVLLTVFLRRYIIARVAAGAQVCAVIGGWYLAQAPFAEHDLQMSNAAAPQSTLVAFLWVAAAGATLLIPSLLLLFSLFKGSASPPSEA